MTTTEIMFKGKLKSSIDGKIADIENENSHWLIKSYSWTKFDDLHEKKVKIIITVEE